MGEEKKNKSIDRHEYCINKELLMEHEYCINKELLTRWQNRILNAGCGQYSWQNSNLVFIYYISFPLHNDKYFNSLAECNLAHVFIFIVLSFAYFRSFHLWYI